jgi:hypothetical protein
MSGLGISSPGVVVRDDEGGLAELQVLLTHEAVRGERVLTYTVGERELEYGLPDGGRELGIAVYELSVEELETMPRRQPS